MKLKVLTDNNTFIDSYYLGEPAVSYYLEEQGTKILFDTGYSDVYVRNADKMGIDLKKLDYIVLSHGHDDHTGGLVYLPKREKSYTLVAHNNVFEKKSYESLSVGSPLSYEEISKTFKLKLTKEPVKLTNKLTFLGEIPRINDYENQCPIGIHKVAKNWEADYVLDDSALVYETDKGIYIITGCSHSGICNIIEYAKNITGKEKVIGVIGGFHLMEKTSRQLEETCKYFKKYKIKDLYPCHCTCFNAKAAINNISPIHEVGVGLELEW